MHFKQIGPVGNGDAATTKGYHVNSTAPLRWRNKRDVEFVFTDSGNPWTESRCTVASIEANGSSAVNIFLSEPCWTAALSARKVCYPGSGPCVPFTPRSIENVLPEATPTPRSLAPGSWYCDRKEHAVYYSAESKATPPASTVIGPSPHLIVGEDGLSAISFESIVFEFGGSSTGVWAEPNGTAPGLATDTGSFAGPNTAQGFVSYQAGFYDRNFSLGDVNHKRCTAWPNVGPTTCWKLLANIPAALSFKSARRLEFTRCHFRHFGTAGLTFSEGSRDNVVRDCNFVDISGSALTFGGIQDFGQPDSSRWTSGNVLKGSLVERSGAEFAGTAGVTIGWAANTIVEHSLLRDLPCKATVLLGLIALAVSLT
eukprot:COSAG04_NODE_624_length_11804_cov_36.044425_10_plen_370_part_00